jgi:hypothetical protein
MFRFERSLQTQNLGVKVHISFHVCHVIINVVNSFNYDFLFDARTELRVKKTHHKDGFLNGAPQCIVVEPQEPLYCQSNLLEYNENPLVVTKTYSVKWQKDAVDLVELAKKRWIDQMSYREIGKSMEITRGQVDCNLRKFKQCTAQQTHTGIMKKIWEEIEKEESK